MSTLSCMNVQMEIFNGANGLRFGPESRSHMIRSDGSPVLHMISDCRWFSEDEKEDLKMSVSVTERIVLRRGS